MLPKINNTRQAVSPLKSAVAVGYGLVTLRSTCPLLGRKQSKEL
ncbi:hypothetical protein QWZ13_03020 [Reinekea marina]|nr:hypothetical protein [Reinekea marina]MDN3647882.1 hypothetical protein [Reinekea marina]